MSSRIIRLIKTVFLKLKYGKTIVFSGFLDYKKSDQFDIGNGTLRVGKDFVLKPGVYFRVDNGGQLTIGNSVSVNRNCILACYDAITVEEHCSIGPNTVIYDHDHRFGIEGIEKGYKTSPVVIERNCWIGAGVTVLRGTHIGEGSVIGAGAIVKGNIPPHSLVKSGRDITITPIVNR